MAKKKNVPVAVEAPASGGEEVVASDLSPEAHMANLKDLNRILLKDTVELREQISQLRSEIAALATDHDILKTEHDVCKIVLSSTLSDAAALSTAEMAEAAEMAGKMLKKAESVAAELNAAEMGLVDVAREKDRVERDLERVTEERDLSRSDLDEKRKDYVDLEESFRLLKLEIAEMSKKKAVADAKCGKVEEEGRRMKAELLSVMREKDLLERCSEDAKHLVEKLGREMEVLKSQKDIDMDTLNAKNKANASKVVALEEECRLLKGTIGQMENEVGELKVSLEELKEENLSLVARYEESEKRYVRVEKDFNRNSIENARLEKEKLELEKAIDMKEKEMALQINELKEKMTTMEGEKNLVEIQIRSLEDAHSSCCEKIAMNETYCADMQREKNQKAEEIVSLQMQLNESLKNRDIMEITVEELQRELNHVTAEKKEAKKQIDCLIAEKASLKKNLQTSNQELQDVEKKLKALEDSSAQVFALLKKMTAEVKDEKRTQENHINRENGAVEGENDEERNLFVDNLVAIKVAIKGKERIIKDLNQKLELLQLSVAHAKKNKWRTWKWVFPATTGIFAAASLAYAARAR